MKLKDLLLRESTCLVLIPCTRNTYVPDAYCREITEKFEETMALQHSLKASYLALGWPPYRYWILMRYLSGRMHLSHAEALFYDELTRLKRLQGDLLRAAYRGLKEASVSVEFEPRHADVGLMSKAEGWLTVAFMELDEESCRLNLSLE